MKRILYILLLLGCAVSQAQERLTLQDAIARTLKHNFDINIANLAADQAEINNTLGNAGFLPNVSLNSGATTSLLNVKSKLVNGSDQNNPHARAISYTPNIAVGWTIFDGGKMFLVKKQLDRYEEMGQVQLRQQVQTMVARTIQTYADVVWRRRQIVAIDTALYLARARMDIANLKYETGAGAKIDYLQAEVDFAARLADSINYVQSLMMSMDSLAILIGDQRDVSYTLDDTMSINTQLQPVDKATLEAENLTLNIERLNSEVIHLNARIAKTYHLPTVNFIGGLTYTYSTSSTGFALSNRSYGGNGGFTLSMPLYQGGNIKRQAKIASLDAMKQDLQYEKQFTSIAKRYRIAWRNYLLAVAAYNLERRTIVIAKENEYVQQQRFRVGIGTTLEARQAENDYVASLVRLYTAEYNLKISEIAVLQLDSQLVKDIQQ